MKKIIFLFFLIFLFFSCAEEPETPYIKSVKDFHAKRIERLKKPNSWLSLIGLYWLKEGKNRFGTDKSNDLVIPAGSASEFVGFFTLKDSVVSLDINEGLKSIRMTHLSHFLSYRMI